MRWSQARPAAPGVWVIAVPLTMTAAYGGMRIVMALLTQARDGLFAKVAMNAVRRLAVLTFEHMHQLSLRFHLERKTGGLDPRARARTQRHRDHRADGDPATHPDHRRGAG